MSFAIENTKKREGERSEEVFLLKETGGTKEFVNPWDSVVLKMKKFSKLCVQFKQEKEKSNDVGQDPDLGILKKR